MLFKIMDTEQKPANTTVECVQVSSDTDKVSKSRVTRRCMLVSVTSILLGGLALTAVLVGIKLYTNAEVEIIKFTVQFKAGDHQAQENVARNAAENLVEYNVVHVDQKMEHWILQDFSREIQVISVKSEGGRICYIMPLNHTRTSNATSSEQLSCPADAAVNEVSVYYERSSFAVKETEILGSRGQQLCADTNAFWLFPVAPYDVTVTRNGSNSMCKSTVYASYIQPTRTMNFMDE